MSDQEKKWTLHGVIIGLAIFIGLLLIFKVGVFVGMEKAEFTDRLNARDPQAIQGLRPGMMRGITDRGMMPSSSTIGTISKINGTTLTVTEKDGTEKTVTIDEKTIIRKDRVEFQVTDLKTADQIVVFGKPDQNGNIIATLIHAQPSSQTTPSPTPANSVQK